MLGTILPIFSNKKFLMFCNFPRLSHIILWQHLKKGEAVHTTWINWLFMYIIFCLVKEHFFYIETSSLLAKSCKIKAFPLWLLLLGGLDLYRALPVMTRDLGLHGLIQRTTLIRRLWRQPGGTEDLFLPRSPWDTTFVEITLKAIRDCMC